MQNFLLASLKGTFWVLLYGAFPLLLSAFLMHGVSALLRRELICIFGPRIYVYGTGLGVAVHESGHVLFCLLFGHSIHKIKFFSPQSDGTLGYVKHTYNLNNPFQVAGNFFIGTGPVWFGTIILILLTILFCPGLLSGLWSDEMNIPFSFFEKIKFFFKFFASSNIWCRWQGWLWVYLILTIGSHITLSLSDLKASTSGFGILILLTLGTVLLALVFGQLEDLIYWVGIAGLIQLYFFIFIALLLLVFSGLLFLVRHFLRIMHRDR